MLTRRGLWLQVWVFCSALCVAGSATGQESPAASTQATPLPEIVRIRIVEGDVRIARGKAAAKEAGGAWEQAVADLPLESGFNLTTGDGRAEIEFEDASTVYVGENSALSLDDLHTTNGVPHTEMTLLTGTATLHLQPAVAGETFVLRTLTDRIHVNYPDKLYQRVTSYLDAVALTRLQEPGEGVDGATVAAKPPPTVTVFHRNGKVVEHLGDGGSTGFAAWDAWVADRVAEHEAAAAEVAQESGLPASTPGLADMSDEGVFFKCEPYGVCWAPNDAAPHQVQRTPMPVGDGPEFQPRLRPSKVGIYAGDSVSTKLSAASLLGFSDPIDVTTTLPQGFTCLTLCSGQMFPGQLLTMQFGSAPDVPLGKYQVAVTLHSGPLTHVVYLTIFVGPEVDDDYVPVDFGGDYGGSFPCYASGPHLPVRLPRGARYGGAPGYAWGVCHSGTWIYRQHGYVWVVGQKKHHHWPVHPIGCRGKLCYVPIHPRDEKGRLPLNLKYIVYRATDKKGTAFEAVTLRPKDKVEVLAEMPKAYLDPAPLRLAKAETPKLEARDAPVATVASAKATKPAATSDAKTNDAVASTSATTATAAAVEVAELYYDEETDAFLLEHMLQGGGGGSGRMVTETVEEHRESMRPSVASGGGGGHVVTGSGAHGTAHGGASAKGSSGGSRPSGGGSHGSSGGSHTSSGGSHASSGGSSGGSHASPPPPPPAPASHH